MIWKPPQQWSQTRDNKHHRTVLEAVPDGGIDKGELIEVVEQDGPSISEEKNDGQVYVIWILYMYNIGQAILTREFQMQWHVYRVLNSPKEWQWQTKTKTLPIKLLIQTLIFPTHQVNNAEHIWKISPKDYFNFNHEEKLIINMYKKEKSKYMMNLSKI